MIDTPYQISGEAVRASGTIQFTDNPSDQEAITLNGKSWTFVTSGATGRQTNIGASLSDTLTQLVSDLNGSTDVDIDDATYSESGGDTLEITHDIAGSDGNSFALSDDGTIGVTRSGDSLSGGSGNSPIANIEVGSSPTAVAIPPRSDGKTARFVLLSGSVAFYFMPGPSTISRVVEDMMIWPEDTPILLNVSGQTHMLVASTGGTAMIRMVALENH